MCIYNKECVQTVKSVNTSQDCTPYVSNSWLINLRLNDHTSDQNWHILTAKRSIWDQWLQLRLNMIYTDSCVVKFRPATTTKTSISIIWWLCNHIISCCAFWKLHSFKRTMNWHRYIYIDKANKKETISNYYMHI